MWLVKGALGNPHAVIVGALLFLVAGVVALSQIPMDILPAFRSPGVLVLTFYNGMPTTAIDRNITTRMERWCGQATGVVKVESKSMTGISIVRLYFRDDIDPAAALTEVNSLALSTLKTLPPGTLPPIVRPFDPTATLPLCILSVSSPDGKQGEAELQDLARVDLRNQLGGLPGVIAPTAFGGRERAVMVYVRPHNMEVRHLCSLDVVDSLRDYNTMLAGGTVKVGDEEIQLESNALVVNVPDFNEVVLKGEGNKQVYLKDVGEAIDGARVQTALVRIDGRPQVYVPVYRQQGASSISVVDSVQNELPLMEQRSPDGVDLDVVMDQSVYVRHAIEGLVHEGILGALLAAGMILIFLGDFRSTMIATLSIPLAVLAAIAALLATGNTINAMTLGGLALAIGPLVDNSIVVLENTHRHMGLGKTPLLAAGDGAGEVAQPAVVATLSTIIVLVPLALMPGMGKFLFKPLALAVAFSMLASLFLALTFAPSRAAAWLRSHGAHLGDDPSPATWGRRLHHKVEMFLHWLTRRYQGMLDFALRKRALVLGSIGGLFVASLGLYFGIGQEFFPQVDSGQLTVYFRCSTGTRLEKTNERVAEFEQFIKDVIPPEDLRMIISELGTTTNWSSAYTANSGPQDAVIKIQLTDERSLTSQQYAALLRRKFQERQQTDFSDLRISFDTGGMITAALNYGASSPIEIQVLGGSLQDANRKAREIRELARQVPGAVDVRILQRFDYPQIVIEIDRKKAQELGFKVPTVFQNVTTALNSSVVVDRNFWLDPKNGNQYWIGVQYYEDSLQTSLDEVGNMPLTSPKTGQTVKLGTLVRFQRRDAAPAELTHDNLANVVSVMVNTEGRDTGGVAGDIQAKIDDVELPRGMVVRMRGEYERMKESFSNLGFGLILASVLVYLLMVAQFRSYLSPFIIMFAVPLGLIGVLITLFVTGTTLNVQSLMGVIFMVGIVVANSTLLVDFANKQRALGASVHKAITTAAAIRLRPILMTFLATFLGLLPMAIGMGKGSEANVPLGRAVVGGLLASTFLTLFVVPILYTLFNRDSVAGENGHDATPQPAPVTA